MGGRFSFKRFAIFGVKTPGFDAYKASEPAITSVRAKSKLLILLKSSTYDIAKARRLIYLVQGSFEYCPALAHRSPMLLPHYRKISDPSLASTAPRHAPAAGGGATRAAPAPTHDHRQIPDRRRRA
jgi:hypothetical protein